MLPENLEREKNKEKWRKKTTLYFVRVRARVFTTSLEKKVYIHE